MKRKQSTAGAANAAPTDVDWSVTVTERLPDCPSVEVAWERLASQATWVEWRSPSKMSGEGVVTTLVPPATDPLEAGDEYVVRVNRFIKIRCRVIESSSRPKTAGGERVFDALGMSLGGMVKARFRFTVFDGEDGVVTARAQEKITALPVFIPPVETLESEHRHTFKALNASFAAPSSSS